MSNNTKKPWGGRFKGKTNEFVESFTSSIAFDYRLWPYDLRVTIAHSKMLKEINNWKDAPLWDESSIKVATKNWFKYMKTNN